MSRIGFPVHPQYHQPVSTSLSKSSLASLANPATDRVTPTTTEIHFGAKVRKTKAQLRAEQLITEKQIQMNSALKRYDEIATNGSLSEPDRIKQQLELLHTVAEILPDQNGMEILERFLKHYKTEGLNPLEANLDGLKRAIYQRVLLVPNVKSLPDSPSLFLTPANTLQDFGRVFDVLYALAQNNACRPYIMNASGKWDDLLNHTRAGVVKIGMAAGHDPARTVEAALWQDLYQASMTSRNYGNFDKPFDLKDILDKHALPMPALING